MLFKIRLTFLQNKICKVLKLNDRGIALFMVMMSLAVIGLLVTEFSYTSHLNYRIAQNAADATKAHYLAKSGLEIAKIRLKIFREINKMAGGKDSPLGGLGANKAFLEKIWSFPFIFPPPALPGVGLAEREAIDKFVKESAFDGKFKMIIEGESSKINLNSLISAKRKDPRDEDPISQKLRKGIAEIIDNFLNQKREDDETFAKDYKNLKGEEVINNIMGFVDKYQRILGSGDDKYQYYAGLQPAMTPKDLPFYNITELHYVKDFDDKLYKLLAPLFTVLPTKGLNINKIDGSIIQAIFPELNKDDVKAILEKRDNLLTGVGFNSADDFFKYLQENVRNIGNIEDIKKRLQEQNITLITDEDSFKINIEATSGLAKTMLTAYMASINQYKPKPKTEEDPNKKGQKDGTSPGKKIDPATGKEVTDYGVDGKKDEGKPPVKPDAGKASTENKEDDIRIIYIKER